MCDYCQILTVIFYIDKISLKFRYCHLAVNYSEKDSTESAPKNFFVEKLKGKHLPRLILIPTCIAILVHFDDPRDNKKQNKP